MPCNCKEKSGTGTVVVKENPNLCCEKSGCCKSRKQFLARKAAICDVQTKSLVATESLELDRPGPNTWKPAGTDGESEPTSPFQWGVQSGNISSTGARVSARVIADSVWVKVRVVCEDEDTGNWLQVSVANNIKQPTDNIVYFDIDNLTPNTQYNFIFIALAAPIPPFTDDLTQALLPISRTGRFKTAPDSCNECNNVRFAITSCFDPTSSSSDGTFPNASFVSEEKVDLTFLLGDTIYADAYSDGVRPVPQTADDFRAVWESQLKIKGLRDLLSSSGIVSLPDDHELDNDWNNPFPIFTAEEHMVFITALTNLGLSSDFRAHRDTIIDQAQNGGTASTIKLGVASANATVDYYKNWYITIANGTGSNPPQMKLITAYNPATNVATISSYTTLDQNTCTQQPGGLPAVGDFQTWTPLPIPDATSVYYLFSEQKANAKAATANTITLSCRSSVIDNFYNNNGYFVKIISGTGQGQIRTISGYVGATNVATVSSAWTTIPDATSVYILYTDASSKTNVVNGSQVYNETLPYNNGTQVIHWGCVDFFILDSRSNRDVNNSLMVPVVDMNLIKSELSASTAIFKVVINQVSLLRNKDDQQKIADLFTSLLNLQIGTTNPFAGLGNSATHAGMSQVLTVDKSVQDRWEGYLAQRNELLNFVNDNNIAGVVFACGDTHAPGISRLEIGDNLFLVDCGPAGSSPSQDVTRHDDAVKTDITLTTGQAGNDKWRRAFYDQSSTIFTADPLHRTLTIQNVDDNGKKRNKFVLKMN